jgi:predicted dehydrogenase
MRDLISKGLLGTIQRIDAQYYQGWINSIIHGTGSRITGVWRLDPKHAGASSCMGDIGVHAFNLIEYTTGLEVKEVLSDLNPVKEDINLTLMEPYYFVSVKTSKELSEPARSAAEKRIILQ